MYKIGDLLVIVEHMQIAIPVLSNPYFGFGETVSPGMRGDLQAANAEGNGIVIMDGFFLHPNKRPVQRGGRGPKEQRLSRVVVRVLRSGH